MVRGVESKACVMTPQTRPELRPEERDPVLGVGFGLRRAAWDAACHSTVGHTGGPDKWASWASRTRGVSGSGSQGTEEAQVDVHPRPPPLLPPGQWLGSQVSTMCQGSACSEVNSRSLGRRGEK